MSEHYGDDYFFAGGAGYNNYLASEQIITAAAHRYARLLQSLEHRSGQPGAIEESSIPSAVLSEQNDAPKSIFSIGTAAGFDLAAFRQLGWATAGLEPNAAMVQYAREKLQLNVSHGCLEDYSSERHYEFVTAIQVMAHFTDIQVAARRMSQLLQPQGLLLIETWNFRSWLARSLGKYWHEYSPPTVLQWFSPQSLDRLMAQHGLQPVILGRPTKQVRGDHARSLLAYKLSSFLPKRMAAMLVKPIPVNVSLPYPALDLFYAVYRKA